MSITRSQIVAPRAGWIGTPYRHQAWLKGVGCDCLGLVRGVWRELFGGEPEPLPAYSRRLGRGDGPGDAARARRGAISLPIPPSTFGRATCCCSAGAPDAAPSTRAIVSEPGSHDPRA